jgi:hypothetical protein
MMEPTAVESVALLVVGGEHASTVAAPALPPRAGPPLLFCRSS